MKKSLSLLLTVLLLLTSFTFLASAQEAEPIVFNLIEADGTVPFGKGRNGDCCFYKGSSTINPELYFWGSATAAAVDGFIQINSTKGNSTLEFDTFPSGKTWVDNGKHTFIAMNIKTGAAIDSLSLSIYALGQKYRKAFPLKTTGEWQQIIIDLNDPTGWFNKDGSAYGYSPMKSADGKQTMAVGFRIDMPVSLVGGVTVDYIGLFASEAQAKAYKGRKTPASSDTITGKVASSDNTGSSSESESGSASTESGAQTGEAVEIGKAVIFSFIEEDGKIPYGKGKNGDCYFPKDSSTINPEVYTWGKGTMGVENGYSIFYPAVDFGMMELDTFPKDKTWATDKKLTYVGMTIKAESAAETSITVLAQAAKYKKTFKFNTTGEWQRVVLDLNNTTGWQKKNDAGQYDAINYSPMKAPDGKQVMNGGMRLDFAGNTVVNSYMFDSFGIFGTLDAAKGYILREKANTVTVSTGSEPQGGTTAPKEEEKEPAEPEKPKMKDALTRGQEVVLDRSITLKSAVPASVVTDDAIIYKYTNVGPFQKDGQKYPVIDDEATSYLQTWGQGTFENTTAGVLKYVAATSGGTLFEAHTKKSGDPAKFKYLVLGFKTNEDFSHINNTAYLYTSGNKFRFPLLVNIDSEWHYTLYDLSKIDAYTQGSNYADKATSRDGMNYGAFRIDFPKSVGIEFYIDYIGFFANEDTAKAYIAKSEEAAAADKPEEPSAEEKFTYMKGYDDGTFRPGAQMTRAEAATVIARLLADEEEIAKDRTTAFTDVKKGDWYYSYVTFLEELGYLPNYSGEFKPNQNITRSEFIKLTYEAGGLEFSMKRPNFTDLDKNHPYYKEIVFASGTGIVTGYNNGDGTMSFKPDGEITRAEIATVVNRILKIEATPNAAQEFSDLDNSHWAFGTVMAIASKK